MSIDAFFEDTEETKIKSKIRQRRSQMLVHSCAYYELDTSLIDDHTWQRFANDLTEIQNKYPQYCNIEFYDKEFQDWTGDTGIHLPLKEEWVLKKTKYLIDIWDKV